MTAKYSAVKRYVIQGNILSARQTGESPKENLAKGKVKLEVAPGGRFLVEVRNDKDELQFTQVSDGRKWWTYVPGQNQYSEQNAADAAKAQAAEDIDQKKNLEIKGSPAARETRQIMPLLATIQKNVSAAFVRGSVLTVSSNKDAQGAENLMYLTIDPTTLAIAKLTWMQAIYPKGEKWLIRTDFEIKDLQTGAKVLDSDFNFTPPPDAKLVESVQIPAFTPPASSL